MVALQQLVVFKRKQPRPRLCGLNERLAGPPPFVAGLGERLDHGETGYRRVLAPCWISAILVQVWIWRAVTLKSQVLTIFRTSSSFPARCANLRSLSEID